MIEKKTTKQIRNTLKDNDWGFDAWVEYDKKVWVGLDELQKEIEKQITHCKTGLTYPISSYLRSQLNAQITILKYLLDLCKSQEQKEIKNGVNVGYKEGSKILYPKKCTCKKPYYKSGIINYIINGGVCGRCGGEL